MAKQPGPFGLALTNLSFHGWRVQLGADVMFRAAEEVVKQHADFENMTDEAAAAMRELRKQVLIVRTPSDV